MEFVDVSEASLRLAGLIEDIESGRKVEIVIARDGRPVARLVPHVQTSDTDCRIGVAKGGVVAPSDIDVSNDEINALFDRRR